MRYTKLIRILLALALAASFEVFAQANLEVNTPAIVAIQSSMQARHAQLTVAYDSGAVGFTRDGSVALRDAAALPLAQRGQIAALVAQENADRASLYKEIARANSKPEWEGEIRNTFAQRWIEKARAGWYYQNAAGAWTKK